MKTERITSIRDLVADDGYAVTFQTMGQYRTALLKAIDAAASAQQAPIDLTGLAESMLAPRQIVRNEDGHLFNPAFPILDEGDDVRMFLGAFGIECCQVSMESDCDDEALRDAVWAGEKGCGEWAPTPPAGDGWMLSDIFDSEDGPYALFIRRKPKEPKKSRRERNAAAAPSASPALPERNTRKPAEQQGLFRKFDVRRTDGSDAPGGKHHDCRYFVLDVDHDAHAAAALGAYAEACEATHPDLARDLREKWGASPADQVEDARDAVRYRWLRSDDIEVLPGQREILVIKHALPFTDEANEVLTESDLDAAIDAAMSASNEGH